MAGNNRERRGKSAAADRRRTPKKKISILNQENISWIDYKDVDLLRRFMSERAKVRARRVTGNNAQQQRAVARAIRVAREMALLPYSVRQVTQRSRTGRRDRYADQGASGAAPTPDELPPGVSIGAVEEDGSGGAEGASGADTASVEIAEELDVVESGE